jgi:hypothetical protein
MLGCMFVFTELCIWESNYSRKFMGLSWVFMFKNNFAMLFMLTQMFMNRTRE